MLCPLTAAKYWRSTKTNFRVCSCVPFALGGRCEHDQCVEALENPDICLIAPGENKGGRPLGVKQPTYSVRGPSARSLWHRAMAKPKVQRKRKHCIGNIVPSRNDANVNPVSSSSSSSIANRGSELNLPADAPSRSDANVMPVLRARSPAPRSSVENPIITANKELWDLLTRVGATDAWSKLLNHGMTVACLRITSPDVLATGVHLPLSQAQDICLAARQNNATDTRVTESSDDEDAHVRWMQPQGPNAHVHFLVAETQDIPYCRSQIGTPFATCSRTGSGMREAVETGEVCGHCFDILSSEMRCRVLKLLKEKWKRHKKA